MGVPLTEEDKEQEEATSPNAFGPKLSDMSDQENDSGSLDIPRKKKIFSSSSFYEEPNAIYPTVEEQVEMCRKIADSLLDDRNQRSRGANMFFKRVKRAEKWVVQSSAMFSSNENQVTENNVSDPSAMPYVRISKEPPKLKLILDPRQIVDLKRLREEGVQIVEHNAVSQDLCHNIVKDLNSPTGKGAQLFAKRKKKSMEWVVDEDKVKAHLKQAYDRERGIFTPEPLQGYNYDRSTRPVSCGDVAETVIRAAEAKIMSYPAPRRSAIETAQYYYNESTSFDLQPQTQPLPQTRLASTEPAATAIPPIKAGIYSCRAPRGWTSFVSASTSCMEELKNKFEGAPSQFITPSPAMPPATLSQNSPTSRTYNFNNFNTTPKAWSPGAPSVSTKTHIKKVRPPSVLAL